MVIAYLDTPWLPYELCSKCLAPSKGWIQQTSPVAQQVKHLPAVQKIEETRVRFLGQEDPLEEEMATHSSISCLKNLLDRGSL